MCVLSDDGLAVFFALWECLEESGILLAQFARVSVPRIPNKSEAGIRPIGALPALYGVTLKCRRPQLDSFEASKRRAHSTAPRGIGRLDQVWRTAVRAECAAPERLQHGSFQGDIEKFYGHLQPP